MDLDEPAADPFEDALIDAFFDQADMPRGCFEEWNERHHDELGVTLDVLLTVNPEGFARDVNVSRSGEPISTCVGIAFQRMAYPKSPNQDRTVSIHVTWSEETLTMTGQVHQILPAADVVTPGERWSCNDLRQDRCRETLRAELEALQRKQQVLRASIKQLNMEHHGRM
jgi:hypothetical protein